MHKDSIINRQRMEWLLEQPVNVQLELLNNHFDLIKMIANSLMEQEVESLAGMRYSRGNPYRRWGINPGSIRVGAQKIPCQVPRVQRRDTKEFSPLEMYERFQELPEQSQEMVNSILHGLSMRDYKKVTDQLTDSFGMSPASLSHEVKQRMMETVEDFENRHFEDEKYIGLLIDGKHLGEEQMMVVLGIQENGQKQVLSVTQSHTEHAQPCIDMLQDLVNRGLSYKEGIFVVIDGGKGIRKAVEVVFGNKAFVQRCRWHKRENVLSYLNENDKQTFKRKIQNAYQEDDYAQAKAALDKIGNELKVKNIKAYYSLQEGLEETLTLQKLKVNEIFSRSLGTTNCIESLNSQITKYTRNVKRWMNSEQRFRWTISAFIEAEKSMKKIQNAKKIPKLTEAMKKHLTFTPEKEPKISTKN
jgi:transposase-like protein